MDLNKKMEDEGVLVKYTSEDTVATFKTKAILAIARHTGLDISASSIRLVLKEGKNLEDEGWRRVQEYNPTEYIIARTVARGGGKRGRSTAMANGGMTKDMVIRSMREEFQVSMMKLTTKTDIEPHMKDAIDRIQAYYQLANTNPREMIKATLKRFTYQDLKSLAENLNNNKGSRYAAAAIDKYGFADVHEGIARKRDALKYIEECTIITAKLVVYSSYMLDTSDRVSWSAMVDDVFELVNTAGFAAGQRAAGVAI